MTAKEYLQQAYRLDQRINSHIREKEELRLMACSISSPTISADKVQTSRQTDAPFVHALTRMWEMEQMIDSEIDKLVDLKAQIHRVVSVVDSIDGQMVLRFRYIHNMTWETIGIEMCADRATVIRWHDAAIKKVTVPKDAIVI